MREQKIKEYLAAICLLSSYGPVRGAYVARELKLSRPTVSVALQTLAREGYLTVDTGHIIHLTREGEHVAREAMHEAVRRGKSYHELVGPSPEEIDAEDPDGSCVFSVKQAEAWLRKEQAEAISEAVLILSGRYYCVRVIDVAQFLGLSSVSVRAKLRRMEYYGMVILGEESVVRLTDLGRELSVRLYERHAPDRERMISEGVSPEEAERKVLLPSQIVRLHT